MIELRNLKFEPRPNTSDLKTITEVIGRNSYQRKQKNFLIESGERWLDLGGNIGSFACLALSKRATVISYEPDPKNIEQMKLNLALNNLSCEIRNSAIVHDDRPQVILNLWPQGQSWRNSIVRNKKGTKAIVVSCENFFRLAKETDCVKMDIEGAEIAILEAWPKDFRVKKLVFEYSFDVDNHVARLRSILDHLKSNFKEVIHSKQIETVDIWNFFPPCTMVFCK